MRCKKRKHDETDTVRSKHEAPLQPTDSGLTFEDISPKKNLEYLQIIYTVENWNPCMGYVFAADSNVLCSFVSMEWKNHMRAVMYRTT